MKANEAPEKIYLSPIHRTAHSGLLSASEMNITGNDIEYTRTDTLEIKEVDLEKEFDSFAYTLQRSAIGDGPFDKHFDDPTIIEARNHGWRQMWSYKEALKIAKHFFELGLNVADVDSIFDRKPTEDIFTVLTKDGKIKKKAVNGIVTTNIDGWVDVMTGFIRPEEAGVNFGDKVKLIIIKEE